MRGAAAPDGRRLLLRSALQDYEIAAAVSLHLSSHGDDSRFHYGWLYPLRPRINRVPAYAA